MVQKETDVFCEYNEIKKDILTIECAPKLSLLIAKMIRKFQMILIIENSFEIQILALFGKLLWRLGILYGEISLSGSGNLPHNSRHIS